MSVISLAYTMELACTAHGYAARALQHRNVVETGGSGLQDWQNENNGLMQLWIRFAKALKASVQAATYIVQR